MRVYMYIYIPTYIYISYIYIYIFIYVRVIYVHVVEDFWISGTHKDLAYSQASAASAEGPLVATRSERRSFASKTMPSTVTLFRSWLQLENRKIKRAAFRKKCRRIGLQKR